jgi:hypothetical protein
MLRIMVVIFFAFVFSSCSNKSESILAAFKATEEGLMKSNEAIANSSNVIYHALEDKLSRPESARQASVWQPKAMYIKLKSTEIINYIETLTKELKEEAGLKIKNGREVFQEDNLDAVNRVLINKSKAEELHKKLQQYKQDILSVDPELNKQFSKSSIIITREYELDENKQKDFTKTFFDGVPVITAFAMLRKFENNVRVLENEFITYCNFKIADYNDGFTMFSTLIGQSSNYVKGGDKIEINAGVGVYSLNSNPKVIIMEKEIDCKTNGFATYKFTTPLKAGKYSVPVKIEYFNIDGTRRSATNKIEYTVVE